MGSDPAGVSFREARLADIPATMRIRNGVRENALVSLRIEHADYERAFTIEGRGFVAEVDGEVVGFSCGRPSPGDIWALFLDERYEGRGIGNALMERVEAYLLGEGVAEIWLTTSPGTRAERLYRRRGWRFVGMTKGGEAEYRLSRRG